jgi:DNA replication and repair protein RecF
VGRIVADFCRPSPGRGPAQTHRLEVRLIQEAGGAFDGGPHFRKEILVDGLKRKSSEAVGLFNAVLFLPQMMRVIEGGPDERRRYLNLLLAQVWPRYAGALAEYQKALTQRNALLKLLGERGGDPAQLDYWDESLAASGGELIHARIQAVQEIERYAAAAHRELARGEVLRIAYQPAYDPLPRPDQQIALPLHAAADRSSLSLDSIRSGFRQELQRLHRLEIARGVTSIGPQRDELRILADQIDLGTYGSRGQARTAMLALKLAEVEWMKAKTGQWPVLLLDEVLAELDAQRRQDLLSRLAGSEQALLTTTDLDLFSREFVGGAAVWQVRAGRVEREESRV